MINVREISHISDRGLCIKAASIAGIETLHMCANDGQNVSMCLEGSDDVSDCIHLSTGGTWATCKHKLISDVPDYINDITMAMDLWDILLSNGKTIELISHKEGSYSCLVGRYDNDGFIKNYVSVDSDKPGKAITTAFVLGMDGEDG